MKIKTVSISDLKEDPANVRKHPKRNLEAISGSLARFGQQKPIVVGPDGVVVAGSGTLEAARSLGWEKIRIVQTDLAGADRVAYAIADNRTGELATWDEDALSRAIAALDCDKAIEAAVTGFTEAEIERAVNAATGSGQVKEDEVPDPPEKAITKPGDLWILGEHRLLCGDSTNEKDVGILMGGKKGKLFATDPPYLVDYNGGNRPKPTKNWSDVYHEVDIKNAGQFYKAVFSVAVKVLDDHAAWYCWHAFWHVSTIMRVWNDLGILYHQTIIWVKPNSVIGYYFWRWQHEPCLFGWKKGFKPKHDGHSSFQYTSVWEINFDGKNASVSKKHPTQKPIEIFARPIRQHTDRGDICYEAFSGSGTQIIAAEQLGRRCFAMEIEPRFCDVAIERWENLTGKKAMRGGGIAKNGTKRTTKNTNKDSKKSRKLAGQRKKR